MLRLVSVLRLALLLLERMATVMSSGNMQSEVSYRGVLGLGPKKVEAEKARTGYALDRPSIRAAKNDKRSPIALAALIAEALSKAESLDDFVAPETFGKEPTEERVDVEVNATDAKRVYLHNISSYVFLQEAGVTAKDERIPVVPGLEFRLIRVGGEGQKAIATAHFVHTSKGNKTVTARPFHLRMGSFIKGGASRTYRNLVAPADRLQELTQNGGSAAIVFPKEPATTLTTAMAMLQGGVLLVIFDDSRMEWICSVDFPAARGRGAVSPSLAYVPAKAPLPTLSSAAKVPSSGAGFEKQWASLLASGGGGNPTWKNMASEFVGALVRGITCDPILLKKLADLYYRPMYVATLRCLCASVDNNLRSVVQTFDDGQPMGVAKQQVQITFPDKGLQHISRALLVAAAMVRDYAVRTALAADAQRQRNLHLPRDVAPDDIGNFGRALFQLPKDRDEREEITSIMGGAISILVAYVEELATASAVWQTVLLALAYEKEETAGGTLAIEQLAIGFGQMLMNEILQELNVPRSPHREYFALLCHVAIFVMEAIAVAGLRREAGLSDDAIYAMVRRATTSAAVGDSFGESHIQRLAAELRKK